MKILFLSQRIPEPPNKGDKIRSHHLMRRLAERHEVHVGCLLDDASEEEHLPTLRKWAASVTWAPRKRTESAVRGAAAALSGTPITAGYFRSGDLASSLDELMREHSFDVVVSYCTSMADYTESFDGPRVLDLVDVDSEKWKQYALHATLAKKAIYSLEHRLLRVYERKLVSEFDRSILISPVERKILSRFADTKRVEVVANGVDTAALDRGERPRTESPTLVFVGALDYFANVDGVVHFANHVLPKVRERVPDATLRIVGRRPGAEVHALSSLPGVTVVGEVEDIRDELWAACAAVVPLRIAQGLQNKVLEAMAAGVPVASSVAATRGVEGRSGQHFLAADTDDEMAQATLKLLESRDEADELVRRASELIERKYSWDQKAKEYEGVLEAAVRSRSETHARRIA